MRVSKAKAVDLKSIMSDLDGDVTDIRDIIADLQNDDIKGAERAGRVTALDEAIQVMLSNVRALEMVAYGETT